MRHLPRHAATLIILSGCCLSAGLQAQAAPRVHDSAGVQIVGNGSRASAPAVFRLGATPILDLGGLSDNPDDELQVGASAIRLRDGRIMLANRTSVIVLDASGKRLQVIGRKGAGPGEFRAISSYCQTRGDTIIVSDGSNGRVTVLDGKGGYVRDIPTRGAVRPGACLDDGRFLRAEGQIIRKDQFDWRYHYLLSRTDGAIALDLGEQPAMTIGGPIASFFAVGDQLILASGRESDIRLFSGNNALIRIIRSDDPPVKMTDQDAKAHNAVVTVTEIPVSKDGSRGRPNTVTMPHPDFWPPYGRVLPDLDGRVWVEDNRRADSPGWTAFDLSGRMLGRLDPPPHAEAERWRVVGFGHNELIAARQDDDGAYRVTFYPLVPVAQN